MSREQMRANAAKARAGDRRRLEALIIERDGEMPPDELERAVSREVGRRLELGRARALTARRKARQAADALADADAAVEAAELESLGLDATGLADAGSDGIDA